MNKESKICAGVLALALLINLVAFDDDPLEIKDGVVEDCETDVTNISVPSTYDGEAVTEIGKKAFKNCDELEDITLHDNLAIIGKKAFANCTSLTEITLPETITCIEDKAFYTCENLTTVYYAGTEEAWDDVDVAEDALPDGCVLVFLEEEEEEEETTTTTEEVHDYILNTNTKVYHYPSCWTVKKMNDENKQSYTGTKEDLEEQGYSSCSKCKSGL